MQRTGTHLRNVYDAEGRRVVKRGRLGETLYANQFFDLRNGERGTKHVFAGSMRVASVLSHFHEPAPSGRGAPVIPSFVSQPTGHHP